MEQMRWELTAGPAKLAKPATGPVSPNLKWVTVGDALSHPVLDASRVGNFVSIMFTLFM